MPIHERSKSVPIVIVDDPLHPAFQYDDSDFEAWVDTEAGASAVMSGARTATPLAHRSARRVRRPEGHIVRGEN